MGKSSLVTEHFGDRNTLTLVYDQLEDSLKLIFSTSWIETAYLKPGPPPTKTIFERILPRAKTIFEANPPTANAICQHTRPLL